MAEGGRGGHRYSPGLGMDAREGQLLGGRGRVHWQGARGEAKGHWPRTGDEGNGDSNRVSPEGFDGDTFEAVESSSMRRSLHCQLREAHREEIGWSQNLEAAGEMDADDELKVLRSSAEELRHRGKGVGSKPAKEKTRGKSPGASGEEDKKKKKKERKTWRACSGRQG